MYILSPLNSFLALSLQYCHGDQGEHDLPEGHAEIHTKQGQHAGQYPLYGSCRVPAAPSEINAHILLFYEGKWLLGKIHEDEPYIALSNAKKSLDIEKVLIKGCSSSRWITCPHCQLCWHSLHLFFRLQPPNQEFWYLWSSLTFDFPRPFPDHQQSHPTDQPAKETGLSHPRHSDWRLHHSPPALRFTLNTSAWLESEKERDWSALL